jgi:two-component system, LuxR family, response regulator DctR
MPEPCAHVVDDDEAIRDALAFLFRSRKVASRSYASAAEFLAACADEPAGCLVLDVRMPDLSGPELFDLLLERGFSLPVIFLTGHGDVPLAVSMVKKGAFDFVEKPCNDNLLVDRVIAALDHDAAQRAARGDRAGIAARLARLSSREREVMERVLAGKLNKTIADELNIAVRTVEVHRAHVFEKMGVKSAVELAGLLSRV